MKLITLKHTPHLLHIKSIAVSPSVISLKNIQPAFELFMQHHNATYNKTIYSVFKTGHFVENTYFSLQVGETSPHKIVFVF